MMNNRLMAIAFAPILSTAMVLGCGEERANRVTIFDDQVSAVTYLCLLPDDAEIRITLTSSNAEQAEACLGTAREECPSSTTLARPGDPACNDPSYNRLVNTCVADFFACLAPQGACTTSQGAFTFENGARVESTPAFKFFPPRASNPCIVGEMDSIDSSGFNATTVYIARPTDS